ncbi:hypothetical protein T190607A02C_70097 [Tenacibaculum sp. 190524A02b]
MASVNINSPIKSQAVIVFPKTKREKTLNIKKPSMVILNHLGLLPKKYLNIVLNL